MRLPFSAAKRALEIREEAEKDVAIVYRLRFRGVLPSKSGRFHRGTLGEVRALARKLKCGFEYARI